MPRKTVRDGKSGAALDCGNDYFNGVVREMCEWDGWTSPRTKAQVLSTTRNLLRWLYEQGHQDLSRIGLSDVRTYYMHRAKGVTYFKSARYTMKLAFRYLRRTGRIGFDPTSVFALKVPTRSNLLPAASSDDIAKVLDAIDRSTPIGKRDYAFILIGATTGLRLADIASLRLKDLDWRNGKIDIVQRKTSVAISVPLVRGIGDALSDYILRGRGTTECGDVFLVADGSRRVSSSAMAGMFLRRCRQAGVSRVSRDGKSFHSLRRSVGKRLTGAGVSVEVVAQVLGHGDLVSAEKYICLDADSLRSCALDFRGIGNGGRQWK